MGAADLRQRISDLHSYLILAFAVKGGADLRFDGFKPILQGVGEFIQSAGAREVKLRAREIEASLLKAIEIHSKILPRRAPISTIANDFRQIAGENNVWRYGLSYAWLCKRFPPEALPYPLDLPPHARIGIGPHCGNASVEELFLLEDAFLMFARAENLYQKLQTRANKIRLTSAPPDAYRALTHINAEVGTYGRLTVVTSAAFVEAFVNSVGWREAERRKSPDAITEQLRGKRNDRYLSLEAKLERFPRLIRTDGKSPIVLSDEKQIREPFASFLRVTKEVRDASMHYAPGKAEIWLPPGDWVQRAELATKSAVHVGVEFWSACFPAYPLPRYLDELNYSGFVERARKRVVEQ